MSLAGDGADGDRDGSYGRGSAGPHSRSASLQLGEEPPPPGDFYFILNAK